MPLSFGTSGIRGLNSEFSRTEVKALVQAFVQEARSKISFTQIALAGDLRESTPGLLNLIEDSLRELEIGPVLCGAIPTPALAYFCAQKNIPGMMVTGSHIPADRNGLKFYWPWGEILKTDEATLLTRYLSLRRTDVEERPHLAADLFTRRYVEAFAGYRAAFQGKTVALYEHSSVARDICKEILSQLGFEVLSLGRSSVFIPVDTETFEASRLIQRETAKLGATQKIFAVISTDGDADRPLLTDEHFNIIRGDTLCTLACQFLQAQTVITPINSNTALEKMKFFTRIERTRIGSPFVIEAMMQAHLPEPIVGFEANGGLLLGSDILIQGHPLQKLPTRDALLPVLATLAFACEQNLPLSQLVQKLPRRFTDSDLLKNFKKEDSFEVLKKLKSTDVFEKEFGTFTDLNEIDGLRFTLKDQSIIHFRPSGNAPEFRCYAETDQAEAAPKLVQRGLQFVKNLIQSRQD